ncbi:MAG: hypothetical protein IFK94_03580 [Acidobacteria bacterium]|uniref:Uncharacterized protein n=1 Tax=Candidatus Polarisedimenticola svalbardensis TaxID=2886004 RepID=A0A8J7CDS6_9BACT|nr:hypothetical protein [Candidatus Polarisedimenticola svalbardensis]
MRPLILRYLAGFAAGWLLINLGLFLIKTDGPPSPTGSLVQKMSAYELDRSRFDMVFVGDSRTYCAMHPDLLDPLLGVRSTNLAHWANWLPTQYAQFQDLIETMPPTTTVVWSVGHQNFQPVAERIHAAYPVCLARIPQYLSLGYSLDSLKDNLVFFGPSTTVLGWMPRLRERVDHALERPVLDTAVEAGAGTLRPDGLSDIMKRLRDDPGTGSLELLFDDGSVTSVAVSKTNGAYERVELAPGYFREKQRENARSLKDGQEGGLDEFLPADEYWNTFLAILDLCRAHDVRLVVNEVEEAPYVYLTTERQEALRRFMRETVEREVTARGFPYVRVDFDLLSDADYFDFNHLNQSGIRKYSRLLADRLRPVLSRSDGTD